MLTASGPGCGCHDHVAVAPYQGFDAFLTRFSVEPSFEHTTCTIAQNPQLYEVLYLNNLAYCIYAKRNGEVIQLHYNELDALKEVVSVLITRYPSAMAKNIDCSYCDVIQMLMEIGFTEILKQYEMARDI